MKAAVPGPDFGTALDLARRPTAPSEASNKTASPIMNGHVK